MKLPDNERLWLCVRFSRPGRLYIGKWCDHIECGWVVVTEWEPRRVQGL